MTPVADLQPSSEPLHHFTRLLEAVPEQDRHQVLTDLRQIAVLRAQVMRAPTYLS